MVGQMIGGKFLGVAGRLVPLGLSLTLVTLQQRIAFQLALDIGVQLHVGELQQLNSLLQLGRDDQPLPLTKL